MHYHQLTNIPSVFGENLQPSLTKRVIPVNALHWSAIGITRTRKRMTFVNTTAIAYTKIMRLRPIFCPYAITVVFTNVMRLRVVVWQVDRIANYQLMSNMVTGFRIVCGERANRLQDLLPLNREISDMCWNSESKRAFAVPYSTALPDKPL